MKERPILFSGAMVRDILDGRKTQMRRVMAVQPTNGWHFETPPVLGHITSPHPKKGRFGAFLRRGIGTDFPEIDLAPCPYGQPGDRLWVRETWGQYRAIPPGIVYRADGALACGAPERWRPSTHMPRTASRIALEIACVRVERLRDISDEDCIAEGIGLAESAIGVQMTHPTGESMPRSLYRAVWERLNGSGSWDVNPWVWVVKFRREQS